eukprot:ANDGO_07494.mRNA.1 Vacuolar protein sorting-associated protein 45
MDIVATIRSFVDRLVNQVSGPKAIILDEETSVIVGMTYSFNDILSKEVFLIGKLEALAEREPMLHCAALVFCRPTSRNISVLTSTLSGPPKFASYHLFFSNMLSQNLLSQLAESDAEHQAVKEVHEYFADIYAINGQLFSLGQANTAITSMADGLVAALLGLKKRPHVRYSKGSSLAQGLATELTLRMDQEASLFDFRASRTPLLLILDRREDPVTPLLNQWFYQAMAHELVGINHNRIKIEEDEFVVSETLDSFFKQHMFDNFGDLGDAVRQLVMEHQETTQATSRLETVEDIQAMVSRMPDLKTKASMVHKHVTIMSELNKIVGHRNLFDISAIEQDLACQEDHSTAVRRVRDALDSSRTDNFDRLKLVLLYTLRYQRDSRNQTSQFMDLLAQNGVSAAELQVITEIINYAALSVKNGDLFGTKNILSSFKTSMKRNVKGVENVYTQHEPLVVSVVEQAIKSKLKDTAFPYAVGHTLAKDKYSEIIVFIVGGATYEEAAALKRLESSNPGCSILLGGNTIHNSQSFIQDEVMAAYTASSARLL